MREIEMREMNIEETREQKKSRGKSRKMNEIYSELKRVLNVSGVKALFVHSSAIPTSMII